MLMYEESPVAAITCSAVLSPVHLSVCGKSQEHSTPVFVIFGHSHTVLEDDGKNGDDDDGNAMVRFFGMPSSCGVTIADGDNAFSSVIIVLIDVLVDVAINVDISIVVVVILSSITSRHDAVIINAKTSRSRNNFGILERDI